MVHTKVRHRAVNPQGKRRATKRKMTAKQIRHFGTKRQKAALKAARSRKRNSSKPARARTRSRSSAPRRARRKPNPKQRVVYRTRKVYVERKPAKKRNKKRRARSASNPGPYLLTLGAVNPQGQKTKRRVKKMAAKKHRRKKATARRSRRARASNPVRRRRRRAANPHRRRARSHRRNHHSRARHRSRNPFGISGAPSTVKAIGGILGGVAIAKSVPRFLPPNFTASPWMAVLTTGVTAWVAGWAATKFLGADVGMWVYAGGIAQTGSIALNIVLPSVGSFVTLGDFVPGRFSIPQNPVGRPMLMPPAAAAPRKASVNIGAFHGSRGAM